MVFIYVKLEGTFSEALDIYFHKSSCCPLSRVLSNHRFCKWLNDYNNIFLTEKCIFGITILWYNASFLIWITIDQNGYMSCASTLSSRADNKAQFAQGALLLV